MRLGAALGTTLKRGSCVVATRESGTRLPRDQALDHVRAQLDRRDGGRPADAAGDGRPALAERAELRRRVPRRRVAARPGGGAGQPLRAPGHAALRRDAARRSTRTSRARRHGASRSTRSARSRTRRARPRATPTRCSRRSTPTRSASGTSGSSSTTARSAASSVLPLVLGPLGVESVAAHPFASDSATRPLAYGETLDEARRLVGRGRAPISASSSTAPASGCTSSTRTGAEVPLEKVLLLYLRLLVDERPAGPRRGARQRDEPGRLDGRRRRSRSCARRPRCPALANEAAQEGMIFAGATSGGYIFPRFLPAYDAMAALCNLLELLGADRAAAVRARRRAAAVDARPPRGALLVGAQGHRDARAQRALREREHRPARRDQGLRRPRLDAGAARSGRAADPHLRRGRLRASSRPSSRRRCARSSPTSSKGRRSALCRESDATPV